MGRTVRVMTAADRVMVVVRAVAVAVVQVVVMVVDRVMAVVPAVLRGVGVVVPVAGAVDRVHQAAVAERRVLPAVTAVRPNEVENSTRRSSSASASWTSARGMRAVAA